MVTWLMYPFTASLHFALSSHFSSGATSCPGFSVALPAARSSQRWHHQLSGLLTSVVASPAPVLCARELKFILPGILYVSHSPSPPANSFLYQQPSAVFLHLLLSHCLRIAHPKPLSACLYPHLVFKTLKLSLKL